MIINNGLIICIAWLGPSPNRKTELREKRKVWTKEETEYALI